jgi:hypothetical protein
MASKFGDLLLAYNFIKRLVTPFDETDAFKLGIIDERGKKIKDPENAKEELAFSTFNRLIFNIKKIVERLPGGKSKLASYGAALFLIKESANPKDHYTDEEIMQALEENMDYLAKHDKKTLKSLLEDVPTTSTAGVAATGDDPTVVIDPKKKKKKEILIDKDGRKKEMKAYLKAYLERRAKREEIMKKNEMRRRMGL